MHLVETEETADFIDHALNTIERGTEIVFSLTEVAPDIVKGYLGFRSNPSAPNDLPRDDEGNEG